jgi:uncharacterized protein
MESAYPDRNNAGEMHPHSLLFTSHNGARYLFDSATSTIHPWPWQIGSVELDRFYEIEDEQLPAYADSIGAPAELVRYVLLWRAMVGAFGRPLRHTPGGSCTACGSRGVESGKSGCESPDPAMSVCEEGKGRSKVIVKEPPPMQLALPSMLGNLILTVTDSCNLRCKYCLLGGIYEDFKPHRSNHMTWETAKNAVDHFIALNDSPTFQAMRERKINISFFGGEPLLCGDLIKRVIEYAEGVKKADCGYWIDFALTTNLTHLPDDLAAYLIKRNVAVQVSMDGPPEVHDKYRTDAASRGSFGTTYGNLGKLRDMDRDYFARRVTSVVTLNGNSDLVAINKFFESCDPVIPPVSFVGLIRDFEDSEFHRVYPYDQARLWDQYVELMNEYRRRKHSGIPVRKGEFLFHLFEEALLVLYGRIMHAGTPTRTTYTGTCQPGRRLAVSTSGKFHICERISELFPIGDVETGIDFNACAKILQRYYAALPDCDRCWARPICGTCMANACRNDGFVFGACCKHIRVELAHRLGLLYTILEDRRDALCVNDPLIDRTHMMEVRT